MLKQLKKKPSINCYQLIIYEDSLDIKKLISITNSRHILEFF